MSRSINDVVLEVGRVVALRAWEKKTNLFVDGDNKSKGHQLPRAPIPIIALVDTVRRASTKEESAESFSR